ncbi:MAG: hypothetical protein IH623_31580 [Verrucomicrobia bacterium]|nr:hypothetical protein [Verrucomicrobiota bacterium]
MILVPESTSNRKFVSGLITTDFARFPRPPFDGRGWQITYRTDVHQRCSERAGGRVYRGREIIIHASSKVVAQKAVGLIHAAAVLLWNDPLITNLFWTVEDANEQKECVKEGGRPLFQGSMQDLPLSCLIASKASREHSLVYALHKFLLSCQTYSPDLRSLDPAEGYHFALSKFADDHVRFAYAIIAAYSVLEELGLEVRVWKEHPNSQVSGQWDAAVRLDLENRLRDSGVALSEKILWHLRGTPTRLERNRQPRSQGKYTWARGRVRDCQMEIVDAIAHASWLRSKISSHRLKPDVASLSVYDVANVQHLARRLLLEHLDFWKYHLKPSTR